MDWKEWKNSLGRAVNMGETIHLSSNQIDRMAYRVGDFLAHRVDPKMPEQMVLKELWDVASDDEQRTLASLMVRLVE